MMKQNINGDDRFSLELGQCFVTAAQNLDLVVNQKKKPSTIKRAELEKYPNS
jgi:hypothetical protein